MRFSMTQTGDSNTPFSFRLLADNGTELLHSPNFTNRDTTVNAIRAVIQQLLDTDAYQQLETNGRFSFNIMDENGQILASSPSFNAENQASAAADSLSKAASGERQYQVEFTSTTTQAGGANILENPPLLTAIDFGSFYDFNHASKSGKTGFESFFRDDKKAHYFHFNNANGQAMLYGRSFDSGSKRDKRIRQVIKAAGKQERYEIKEENGQFYFILKEKNSLEIARSRQFASRADAENALTFARTNAPKYADQFPEPAKRKTGNHYDFSLTSNEASGFNLLRGEDKGYYFIVNNEAMKPFLYSQSYSGNKARELGMHAVIRSATDAKYYTHKEQKGKHYFTLHASNRQEIAHSAFFDSKEEMEKAMRLSMASSRAWATKYGVDLNKTTTKKTVSKTESFTLEIDRPSVAPAVAATIATAALGSTLAKGTEKTEEEKPAAKPEPKTPKAVPEKKMVNTEKKVEAKPVPPSVSESVKAKVPVAPVIEKGTVEAASGFNWWWLLGILALGALFLLWRSCQSETPEMVKVETPSVVAPKNIDTIAATAPSPKVETTPPASAPAAKATPNLNWIFFDFDKDAIRTDASTELDNLVSVLKENPSYTCELRAHCDAKGSVAYNEDLSKRRANNAKAYLIKQGIEGKRIKTALFGKSEPLAKNALGGKDTEQGRQFNRRVEISIFDANGKSTGIVNSTIPPAELKN